jgi:hypothetical protein
MNRAKSTRRVMSFVGSLPGDDVWYRQPAQRRGRARDGRGRFVLVAPRRRRPLRSPQRPRLRGGSGSGCAATGVRPVPLSARSPCRDSTVVIEQAPVRDDRGERRGVVARGPVGIRWAGRFQIFRYEIRRWRDGRIPDIDEAVDSPRRLTNERSRAQRVLDLVPQVPTPVWGRDDLKTGDM